MDLLPLASFLNRIVIGSYAFFWSSFFVAHFIKKIIYLLPAVKIQQIIT